MYKMAGMKSIFSDVIKTSGSISISAGYKIKNSRGNLS